MKKVYLLAFFLLLLQNLAAQIEPRVVEERLEYFDTSQNEFYLKAIFFYEYDYFGNNISKITKYYDLNENISAQNGIFYEYNSRNLLSKLLNKNYNPDVDLWITESFVEYYYDDNGCLIETIKKENSILTEELINLFENDEDCKKIRKDLIPDVGIYETYEYLDDNNSVIETTYYLYDGEYYPKNQWELIYNEYGEIIKFVMLRRKPSLDTSSLSIHEYRYDYLRDLSTNLLINKKVCIYYSGFNNITNNITTPYLSQEIKFDYEYHCDGTLAMKDRTHLSTMTRERILYTYEGRIDCIKLEEDLSITISPNPSQGQIEIKSALLASGNTVLKIFDLSGKLILEKLFYSRQLKEAIDLSFLKVGLYILQLQNDDKMESAKLIIRN